MTAFGTVENAVEAMKLGAFDFITKPFNVDHLLMLINRALENRRMATENILLREEITNRLGLPNIIGKSQVIKDVAKKIQKVAPKKTTVLITGESGTGKEVFARALHKLSDRTEFPFVAINCAAIPSGLLESEFFGHEKGSFTGADSRKLGKFELAQGGTVFLDEIGELEPELQAKLLRVLQEGELSRVGGSATIKVDVRIVAASNRNLETAIEKGTFREDLYYRLNVFPVHVPPLRERREDILGLAEYFLKKFTEELKSETIQFSSGAIEALTAHTWKGNVRELENAVERSVILCEGNNITTEHLSLRPISGANPEYPTNPDGTLEEVSKRASSSAETNCIRRALERTGGNKTKAAAILKVSYKTLLTKIKDYGIS
jgi:DNA-binding NtrC family response regulator